MEMHMQRLRLAVLGALLALATPQSGLAQANSTTTYANLDGGILGLSLRPFRFFQQLDLGGDFVRFLETDSGNVTLPFIGARLGWVTYDGGTLNGTRIEARGFHASDTLRTTQPLVAGTAFALITGDEGSAFADNALADYQRKVTVSGGDFLCKWDRAASNRTILSPYAGLSILKIDQEFSVLATDDIDRMTLNDNVDATYYGGSIGIECLTRLFPTTTLIMDLRLSLFELEAERQARQVDTISLTVEQVNQRETRFTGAALLRFEISQQLRWAQVSLFSSIQYFDGVPFVEYGRSLLGSTDFTPSQLRIGDAFGYTAGASVCIPF